MCLLLTVVKVVMIRTYQKLITLPTFKERFEYLKLSSKVGEETFGFERWLNQNFYLSYEWKQVRKAVIVRDMGCDLGCEDRKIPSRIVVHHMNPISPKDIADRQLELLLNPDFLISTCHKTHNAIHFGDESVLYEDPIERRPGDTKLW